MSADAKAAARAAEDSTPFRALARGGYVASGVVHALAGALMIMIAFTAEGESDHATALAEVVDAPFGAVMVWVLAGLMLALGLFQAVLGFTRSDGENKQQWERRLSHWGPAVAYFSLTVVAIAVALGDHSSGDDDAEEASRGVLDMPGGVVILAIGGIAIAIGGIILVVRGFRRSHEEKMDLPSGRRGTFVTVLGVVGYAAKGASFSVIGILVTVAAVQDDPESAGALDSAISALRDLPAGPILVAAMGGGFIAYAAFNVARSRYAKL